MVGATLAVALVRIMPVQINSTLALVRIKLAYTNSTLALDLPFVVLHVIAL